MPGATKSSRPPKAGEKILGPFAIANAPPDVAKSHGKHVFLKNFAPAALVYGSIRKYMGLVVSSGTPQSLSEAPRDGFQKSPILTNNHHDDCGGQTPGGEFMQSAGNIFETTLRETD